MNSALPTIPHNIPAERMLLGTLLMYPHAHDDIVGLVGEDSFHHPQHAMVFKAITEMRTQGELVDIVTVADALRGNVRAHVLADLSRECGIPDSAKKYAALVAEAAMLRRAYHLALETMQSLRTGVDAFELTNMLFRVSSDILERRLGGKGYTPISEVALAALDEMERAYAAYNAGTCVGLATGFPDIDKRVSGYRPGDYVLIAARPAMGKTALAVEMVRRMAAIHGRRIGFFSLEMPAIQLVTRMIAIEANEALGNLRSGNIPDGAWKTSMQAVDKLRGLSIFFDDTAAQTIANLSARASVMTRREKIDVIFVDYLGLIREPRGESREREIGQISQGLKALAKTLGIPVIALSQLSRKVEERGNKRPMLSDLRDSGSLEQDADLVHFVYRPEYYGITTDDNGGSTDGVAEFITAKYRNGETGVDRLGFEKETTRFYDWGARLERRVPREPF